MKTQLPSFLVLLVFSLLVTQCSTSKKAIKHKETNGIQQPVVEREFRAAWIASVANINWPSEPGLPVEKQKEEAIELLDFLADNNFNAAILQVRPQCDALYPSELEPWSYYLTNTQGEAPQPFYDPLQFWIDEAHKRAIELHAWLNPYRAHHVAGGPISDQSIVKTKPDLVVKLETGYYWMEPTAKETQDHSYSVVMDIVKRYDVDGIHFDDYFYPYPSYNNDKDFPDNKSWANYQKKGGKLSKGDWRRDAVNKFMKRVYEGIKAEKKHVKFGLSPFGIWRPNNPPSIKGFDQYEKLYADAKLWLNEGWIDYWTPQLYWPINKIPQSFPVLLGWWNQQNYKGRHFWPGISLSRKTGKEAADEVINQIMITRGILYNSPGIVHWSIAGFTNSEVLTEAVVEGPYAKKALVPASPWLDNKAPNAPEVKIAIDKDSLSLHWSQDKAEELFAYVVYKKYGEEWTYDILDRQRQSRMLSGYVYKNPIEAPKDAGEIKSIDEIVVPLNAIAVTAVDKFGNESALSQINVSDKTQDLIPELGVFLKNYPKEAPHPKETVQAIVMDIDAWSESDNIDLNRPMNQISNAGYNTVLYRFAGRAEGLAEVIDAAHREKLKLFIIIDDENTKVNQLVNDYNLDGFVFNFDDYASLKDQVVDIMLVKPYLITGIDVTNDSDRQKAEQLLTAGIVDLQLSDINEYIPGEAPETIEDPTPFPKNLKKVKPTQVIALNLAAFWPEGSSTQAIDINGLEHKIQPDDDGWYKFIAPEVDTFLLGINGETLVLPTRQWALPYRYIVKRDSTLTRSEPWVEFRNMPPKHTTRERYDLLGKTDASNKGFINGEETKVYKTGVFFNTVQLKEGANRIRVSVLTDIQETAFYEQEIFYNPADKKRPSFPLWVDERTVSPAADIELTTEDKIQITFDGSKGQEASVEVIPGGLRFACLRADHDDFSTYQTELPLSHFAKNKALKLIIRLNDSFVFPLENAITVRDVNDFPYVKVTEDNVRLTYNQGPIRLGGPVRAEYQKGIILKTNGKLGKQYKIRLNEFETGMVNADQVEELPAEFSQEPYFITNMSCAPDGHADLLNIPYLHPVPYEVIPEPNQQRIVVRIFGAKTSSTWITHRTGRKVIEKVTWKQTTPETYEVYINLKTSKIWGYEVVPNGKKLSVKLKHPPVIEMKKKKPLTGLKIAIEAGHGGTNTGARGLSGLLEKDINLDLSLRLGELCEAMGAEVIQVRATDIDMSLLEKRDTAQLSNADLLISIHANAAGGGFLRVAGTSTYYHNAFWAPLAEKVYDRLLETNLNEFGVIGSFNYTVIRTAQMPAILVEQAFLTHAEDEEKLADPEFRQQMANKIYEGIIDYLEYMLE